MWVFVDHSGVEQVIYNMEEFREEYSFNCSMKGHCSMELKSVSRANAGKYFCKANTLTSPFTLVVEYNVNVGSWYSLLNLSFISQTTLLTNAVISNSLSIIRIIF